jgi:general secretion pathway protein D
MSTPSSNWHKHFAVLTVFTLCAALQAHAQGRGGGFGGNFGGGAAGGRSSSTTSPYPSSTTIPDAYFSIDPETRRVVTIADEETSAALSLVISNLDRPKPQVLINVVFLEVTYNNASDIGIEGGWDKQIQNNGSGVTTTASGANAFGLSPLNSVVGTNFNALGQPVSSFAQAGPMTSSGAGLYQIMGQNYQATLRAIAQAGSVKVLSRPTILARNNQPATITVGEEVPLITGVRYDNYGNVINSIQYQNVGVILNVTPFITSQGLVEMIVAPTISSIDPTLSIPISATATAPVIDVREANTVAVTPDGETVIIGGLMEDDKTMNVIKIPFLGDIPLLGNLFRRTQKSTAKTELIIFLTPHIAQNPSQLVALSEKEKERSNGPKAFTDKDLNRFLDTLPPKDLHKDAHKKAPKETPKPAPKPAIRITVPPPSPATDASVTPAAPPNDTASQPDAATDNKSKPVTSPKDTQ